MKAVTKVSAAVLWSSAVAWAWSGSQKSGYNSTSSHDFHGWHGSTTASLLQNLTNGLCSNNPTMPLILKRLRFEHIRHD